MWPIHEHSTGFTYLDILFYKASPGTEAVLIQDREKTRRAVKLKLNDFVPVFTAPLRFNKATAVSSYLKKIVIWCCLIVILMLSERNPGAA